MIFQMFLHVHLNTVNKQFIRLRPTKKGGLTFIEMIKLTIDQTQKEYKNDSYLGNHTNESPRENSQLLDS